jgi:hypothetical protein
LTPWPGCKPRVRPSIVSRPMTALELIRICGRRSDLLPGTQRVVRSERVLLIISQVSISDSFFANIAQMILACLAAIATHAR